MPGRRDQVAISKLTKRVGHLISGPPFLPRLRCCARAASGCATAAEERDEIAPSHRPPHA